MPETPCNTSDPHTDRRIAFVSAMRGVPGAVAIVATCADGERTGLAATAWNSLSADPPMLLACVNRKASAHALVQKAGAFSVSLLCKGSDELVAIFSARRGLEGAARFGSEEWLAGPLEQPMLASAVASFECRLIAAHDHGSHTILIGEVGEIRQGQKSDAMLYVDGAFASAMRLQSGS